MAVIKPYRHSEKGKKEQVAGMFNNIAPKYDFLNHFLSFGIDKIWRRKAIRLIKPFAPSRILDVATGTGDLAIEAIKSGAAEVVGIDISAEMLSFGRKKIKEMSLDHQITLMEGDSEDLDFPDASFDAVTVAFGVRNFEDLPKGLAEINRVLRKGGVACILEFSKPKNFPFKQFYHFYSFSVLPFIGRIVSNDHSAYNYLPESVNGFPDGHEFLTYLKQAGFNKTKEHRQTFGVATIYIGIK